MGGGAPPEPPGGESPPPPPMERFVRNDLDLILEDSLYYGKTSIDLSKGRLGLSEIDDKLKDLLDK
ncbi:MAG: hypothetical protein RLZZ479_1545 [Bacteroidota bacterium]